MIRDAFLGTQGIHNFRDYGGWSTQDGGSVRTGVLFRSGHHVDATDADLAAIAPLGIRTVIDLRGESERAANPCRRVQGFDGTVVFYEGETTSSPPHMDIRPDSSFSDFARGRMLAVYTRMADNPAMIEMFGRYLNILAQRDGASLVHCYAGKDRTGVAATMLLHILGVSVENQRREFLRTNDSPTYAVLARQSLPGIEARLGRRIDEIAARDLLGVREEYLDRYLEIATARHGSLDGYLEKAIGVDDALRDALIARFLA
ncbi:tyrosine-protein phosphatase [Qipengyuania qiaonensis]|uniref:Tyrosine-protein phosphatase n=1 Tax=Qipengyuania qiaonensis TaxID=2867240 RepID=A0ABS7J5I2_9SPHN|nr:tyrosine-protein phosphatase [Qipengyuania qiaonensis]MBX7482590.1 tyrosine-protein phosphatase [Qipengyuania qiaonensis]